MSIPFQGFCAPSYFYTNKYAGVERCINWYCVPNEAAEETKFKLALAPSPGNQAFGTLPVPPPFNQPCRGLIQVRDEVFGVNGNIVFGLDQNGNYRNIGTITNDGGPVSMVANGNAQVFIASAGSGFVIPPGGLPGTLISLGGGNAPLGCTFATFQDGYILVINPNSNVFQISGTDTAPLGDATQWDPANVSVQAGQADLLQAIISSREYVRLLGKRRSQVYYNVGSQGIGSFPFQSWNETFIETGIAAPFSLVDMGDSLMWIGQDDRGIRSCWRDPAFSPQRVSNFAVEQQWQNYAKISDAVAFAYLWRGHLFYQITFPSAFPADPVSGFPLGYKPRYISATWLYDATASTLLGRPVWTERSYQTAFGLPSGRSEQFHCFCYGKHLVGSVGIDGNPGAIYQYSDQTGGFTDCGVDTTGAQRTGPIVRTRIAPHLFDSNKRLILNRLELEIVRGAGLDGSPVVGTDPQFYLRMSRDAGNTFGPELNASVGKIGNYVYRVYWNRLGYARDMVSRVTYSDPTDMMLIGAEIDVFECGS